MSQATDWSYTAAIALVNTFSRYYYNDLLHTIIYRYEFLSILKKPKMLLASRPKHWTRQYLPAMRELRQCRIEYLVCEMDGRAWQVVRCGRPT